MKKTIVTISIYLLSFYAIAQENITVNKGLLATTNGSIVSTHFDFVNQNNGSVINDGTIYFYGDYTNEGLFSYTTNSTTGYVVFEGKNKDTQLLNGNSPSFFYDALFNRNANRAFNIHSDIESAGTVNLFNGVLFVEKDLGGSFTFLKGAQHINTSNKSHIDGEVIKIGDEPFKYPIGDKGFYRFASISAPIEATSKFTGEYVFENSDELYPHKSRTEVIKTINDKEYWIINRLANKDESVILTLSWDQNTTPLELINNATENLHIVRWDADQQLWVDEGGVVDFSNNSVSTPINVEGFGVFTLATVKEALLNPGDVVIYNGVTPDGNGKNDYFIIDNIHYFPNNHVSIYNRWGRKVYETNAYDTKGNVFKGYAEGTNVVGKGEKLPTGTYYYVVEYLYDRGGANQWVKKVGYLHLENNN